LNASESKEPASDPTIDWFGQQFHHPVSAALLLPMAAHHGVCKDDDLMRSLLSLFGAGPYDASQFAQAVRWAAHVEHPVLLVDELEYVSRCDVTTLTKMLHFCQSLSGKELFAYAFDDRLQVIRVGSADAEKLQETVVGTWADAWRWSEPIRRPSLCIQ
jgi:hypothetical protein